MKRLGEREISTREREREREQSIGGDTDPDPRRDVAVATLDPFATLELFPFVVARVENEQNRGIRGTKFAAAANIT